jgi:hypothetical protein
VGCQLVLVEVGRGGFKKDEVLTLFKLEGYASTSAIPNYLTEKYSSGIPTGSVMSDPPIIHSDKY